jgi:hypothetical protein
VAGALTLAYRRCKPEQAGKPADGTGATAGPTDGEIDTEDELTVRASITALRDLLITIRALLGLASLSRDIERIVGCPPTPVRY